MVPVEVPMSAALATVPYSLEDDVFRLLREEPFFAAISRCVEKEAMPAVGTIGVTITDDGAYKMLYNAEWFGNLSDTHRRGILKHEFYHLLFEHCGARLTYDPKDKKNLPLHKRWNAAFDMAINCHLRGEVPEDGWFPEKHGFKNELSAEEYFNLLNEKYPPPPQPADGEGADMDGDGSGDPMDSMGEGSDNHDGWGEGNGDGQPQDGNGNGAAAAIAKERLREAARKGAEAAARQSKGWGNMSSSIREMIMRFINGSVDWRAVLRNFIGNAQRANRSNSIKRINRRFPYIHPGRKTNHTAHIAIAIDQSGSVSDELLSLFFAELNGLAKMATFTVVPFDTRVDDKLVHEWKKGKVFQPVRVMNGGTNFTAPTEWVNEHPEIDGLIILTDMEAPAPIPCKRRRLWMTDTNGKNNPYFQTDELVVEVRKVNQH
jgi:predicted metal-dependent peptidase